MTERDKTIQFINIVDNDNEDEGKDEGDNEDDDKEVEDEENDSDEVYISADEDNNDSFNYFRENDIFVIRTSMRMLRYDTSQSNGRPPAARLAGNQNETTVEKISGKTIEIVKNVPKT